VALMSSPVSKIVTSPTTRNGSGTDPGQEQLEKSSNKSNYKGFVAGVFSGIAKLSGMSSQLPYRSLVSDF
jgi:hypothetical protein